MIDWGQFHFLRPAWLVLLVPLALLVVYLRRRRASSRGWESVCDPALLPHVLIATAPGRERRGAWLVPVAGVIATLAMAGPTWTRLPQPVFSSTQALVLALDLSRSMAAGDVAPSRVERARFKIADLLRQRQDGQTALLVYAGDAFTVAPLTDDAGTLLSQLPALTPAIMPVPGSRTGAALALARDLLQQAGLGRGDVLLITDEVDGDEAVEMAAGLAGAGYRISVLGVGTAQGAPVPQPDGSFVEDESGEIVIAALEEAPLRKLAAAGGGLYRRLAVDDSDVEALAGLFARQPDQDETRATDITTDAWRDEGPWLVLLLLPLAALGFRRGLVLALLLCVLPLPRPAMAFEWRDLWLRPDQQAVRVLEAGDAARAAGMLDDPHWKGAAHYRAGDYGAAADVLESSADAEGLYNRGNALARLGRYPDAIAAYDEALKRQPDHGDARHNRELVQKALERQQQQQNQSQGGEQPPDPAGQDQEGQSGQGNSPVQEDQAGQSGSPKEQGQDQGQDQDGPAPETQGNGDAGSSAAPGAEDAGGSAGQDPTPDAVEAPGAGQAREQQEPDGEPGQEGTVAGADQVSTEDEQALEQWLRRIPDDPGGLLRRKFQYQYQMRRAQSGAREPGGKTW